MGLRNPIFCFIVIVIVISIVFPAYNEENNVEELHRRLKAVLSSLKESFEIIAVENGSTDGTLEKLKKLRPIRIIIFPKIGRAHV